MPPHFLTKFEIQRYYQDELKFNSVYSRNSLSKIKDGVYIVNLDEYESIGTHCVALYANTEIITYFDSFWVEHVPKEIRKSIENKNIRTNIYRIEAYNLTMCGYSCIGFIDSILKGKSLLVHINLFSPIEYKKNDEIMLKYFQ